MKNIPVKAGNKVTHPCLSCAAPITDRRKRYCSVDCRKRLRRKLDLRTGLLKALNTRYATFYITERVIVLDILPYGPSEIFSFILTRSRRQTPADDFNRMANMLGNIWWEEKRKTNRKYLANRRMLEQAERNRKEPKMLAPVEIRKPSVDNRALVHLRLEKSVLDSDNLESEIKSAFRRQAKIRHPDRGGTSAEFRKLRKAYEQLVQWAENPSFTKRRGFPDKWFYDGSRNRWVQPTPAVRDS